jgi:uncharacterized membrane protein HdeD (DUF308 family)
LCSETPGDAGGKYLANKPKRQRMKQMNLDFLVVSPIVALIFGVLILIFPRLLNYLVAIYLIIVGILGILGVFTQSPP